MQIHVQSVASRREMDEFIKWPMRLYRNDPFFVPPLLVERKEFFGPKNPLFTFTEVAYFLAKGEQGRTVGRVTAHINRRHNDFAGERAGFFGFFECVEDPAVAAALMSAAEVWLRERHMSVIRGPFNFSTNEECGFLAEGFDSLPALMMPYTPRYYLDFMESLGYHRAKDLLAYNYASIGRIPDYLVRFADRAREKTQVTVRPLDMRRFNEEVERIFDVYNHAWEKNWGFIPMTAEEFRFTAKGLRQIIDPDLAVVAEKEGRAVGFSLGLPDFNPIFKKMNGRLFPFGLLRFLLGRRSIRRVRIITLGVIEEFRHSGVETLLIYHTFKNGLPKGYDSCEMSWVLEDNHMARRMFERVGAKPYKSYRIFEKPL